MASLSLVTSSCLLFLAFGLSEAHREVQGAIERWELPKGATIKNTRPLIGIMTQECLHCPGLIISQRLHVT
jgi:hypothetical protein